jgi:hypothetical protein
MHIISLTNGRYYGVNEFSIVNNSAKEWAMGGYLLAKGHACGVAVTTIQGYLFHVFFSSLFTNLAGMGIRLTSPSMLP